MPCFLNPVFLYIDPGTGSYLAQVVIATVLGVAYYFKTLKFFLLRTFRKITGKEEKNNA